jgi:putative glutamine amidotransferase
LSSDLLIGVACELERRERSAAKLRNALPSDYPDRLVECGATPVILPVSKDRSRLSDTYDRLAGLMLPGSDDIPPAHYGQEPHPSLVLMPDVQFLTWVKLMELALARPKPLLCICGGLQVVNVALGGTLVQDIPSQARSTVCHHSHSEVDAAHAIEVEQASHLSRIIGAGCLEVNSAHHQAVDRLGDGLSISAVCPDDGVVEAVELVKHPFFVAVQWHPERFRAGNSSTQLFAAFVDACRST